MPALSVILCTRNPDRERLARTLTGLAAQSLQAPAIEVLLIDNGSTPPLAEQSLPVPVPGLRIVRETTPGLTPARLRGIAEANGELLVFVDDDNVLAEDFLVNALAAFSQNLTLGAAGGPIHPEFESAPPDWLPEFYGLLALHDHGPLPKFANGGPAAPWPNFAPVGAGLCIRRSFAENYTKLVKSDASRAALDRRAGELTSGGDNDLVFSTLHAGGQVAYLPLLRLTHLIPTGRLNPRYLARLNAGIQRSWVRVLSLHQQCPWPPISPWTVPLRSFRIWFRARGWRGPVERIRYCGLRGRFLGQADLSSKRKVDSIKSKHGLHP